MKITIGQVVEYGGDDDGIIYAEHLEVVGVHPGGKVTAIDSIGKRVWAYATELRPVASGCRCDTCYRVATAAIGLSKPRPLTPSALLAAAPELLAACMAAREVMPEDSMIFSEGSHGQRVYVRDLLDAAIAKAKSY